MSGPAGDEVTEAPKRDRCYRCEKERPGLVEYSLLLQRMGCGRAFQIDLCRVCFSFVSAAIDDRPLVSAGSLAKSNIGPAPECKMWVEP